jgi:hypothetical protein
MKTGDCFQIIALSLDWLIHDNTLIGCSLGNDTSFFRNNLIERGGATNATQAIFGNGQFKLTDNHIAGFEEKEAAAKAAH